MNNDSSTFQSENYLFVKSLLIHELKNLSFVSNFNVDFEIDVVNNNKIGIFVIDIKINTASFIMDSILTGINENHIITELKDGIIDPYYYTLNMNITYE